MDTSPATTPQDMEKSRLWAARLIASPGSLPTLFRDGTDTIAGIPDQWNPSTRKRRIDANLIETVLEGTDPASGLGIRADCFEYLDFPVVEWTAWLTHRGQEPTPIISELSALDAVFNGGPARLYHCNGDFCSEEGYTPEIEPIPDARELRFAPNGGRPCDGAFPYFRIIFEDGGLALAVGWPAQWSASFIGSDRGVRVQAGQEKTHLRLMPGETIRTPRITLLAWSGDPGRAANLWRRWYLAHVLPRPNGQPLRPKMALVGTDPGEEFTAATEENQLRYNDKFKKAGFEYNVWWIDAGWYPCYDANHERRWPLTGSWEPDPERFPNGLKPVSDHAARNGADLLVWFEPERVTRGSRLAREHPEWLLTSGDPQDTNRLLNLGNEGCRQWLTDHVCALLRDNGIKIYRQDFNFPPLGYWQAGEAEDRQGMNENLHVQGYLRYWDELLARNPGLWIDSCSSGGRRNDLETMRRSVPLHYTDYGYGLHPVKLAFHHTLFDWIPYFKEFTLSWDMNEPGDDMRFNKVIDSFSYHCGMAAMVMSGLDIRRDDYDFALCVRMNAIWRRAADFLLFGDYYPLTPFSRSPEKWVARQFDRPETGEGFLQSIRLPQCPDDSITVFPRGLCQDAAYALENPETGETLELTGSSLLTEGFTFTLPRRSGAIWFYRSRR
ncbi:MAG: alpha-galactosidase [Armatimonadetes bacterium]|nr:alpha-galactosidase [Armatimonadota bacterium]